MGGRRRALAVPTAARLLLAIFAAMWVGGAAAQAPVPLTVRISCGVLHDYKTSEYNWSKDTGYSSGSVGNQTLALAKESNFTNMRYFSSPDGPNNCYNISVPAGHYLMRYLFGYGQTDNSGREPQFDVSIEGTLGFVLRPGWSAMEDTRYADALVFVDDTAATTCFHSTGHGNPGLVTLEILQLYENAYDLGYGPLNHDYLLIAVARVSCGAKKAAYGTSLGADTWGGDRYWSQDVYRYEGSHVATVESYTPIRNINVPPNFYPEEIYQGATITTMEGSVAYAFPITPSMNYSIWLHFAEIAPEITGPAQRVFDVYCNGEILFRNVDIWRSANGANAAVVLNTTAVVNGRTLTLDFRPRVGNILVCAIEIYQIMERESATRSSEEWALQALKPNLLIPPRMGWVGDPCVPQEHPWDGVDCMLDVVHDEWHIHGIDLENEGLEGSLTGDISALTSIDHINLNDNQMVGSVPAGIGSLTNLTRLNLANNQLSGHIPESLGTLTNLRELFLNNNHLTGKVPAALAAGPIRGASFNFLGNPGLCGIPGLKSCDHTSAGSIAGIVLGTLLGVAVTVGCGYVLWKRRENLARTSKILMTGDAPYAASHTHTGRSSAMAKDVQLSRFGSFTEQRLMRAEANGSPEL